MIIHRLTATDTLMVRYTRTIFPSYAAIITDIKDIISSGQKIAYNATNKAMILTYWHVGKRIVEQEQNGNERAQYGQALIDALADELTKEYGKKFFKEKPPIFPQILYCFS